MGPQFHETFMGRHFFERQLPKLIKSLENLAPKKTTQAVIPPHLVEDYLDKGWKYVDHYTNFIGPNNVENWIVVEKEDNEDGK